MSETSITPVATRPPYPSLGEATLVWLRIGLLSFGGPAGQIALMHKLLVDERRWISESRFLHALSYCMLLPGPEAQQLAAYIGWLLHGTRGAIIAGVLFVLPGFAVIMALSTAYGLLAHNPFLGAVFFGFKAAVLVIVIDALIRLSRRALKNQFMVGLAIASFVALFGFSVPFPIVVLAAGLIGYFGSQRYPQLFVASVHGKAAKGSGVAVIDNDFISAAPSWRRALTTLGVCLLLWAAPLVLAVPLWGWGSSFVVVMAFFSQMAVVTFGGAYAVLAYVAQQAVEHYGWLAPGQMLDGLALAETTPGPLVLVLSYVGFMAGFARPMGLAPLWGGLLGGALATWVTFVPCFLWILLGAPFVDGLRANVRLSGALAAITAAVVGVIANLALWFALHVLFATVATIKAGPLILAVPQIASLDPWALGLSVVAGVALFRLRWGVVPVLALSAALALIATSAGWH